MKIILGYYAPLMWGEKLFASKITRLVTKEIVL